MKLFSKYSMFYPILMALLLAACASSAAAPQPATPTPVSTSEEAVLGDEQELETFVDGIINKQMKDLHIAGVQVVIVKDGQILLSKGYGVADVKKGIPVDAENTLFRPGSVSKLFTWTAVMQMVEQGKIDLKADINTYLTDFQIPVTHQRPITMLDLMAHTAGFAESEAGVLANKPEELTSLGVFLARFMPALVYPAGQAPAYSNYGVTLAGYIVEQVSGEPYDQYIEEHILKPLGMDHSTMRQPLPDQLLAKLSHSYTFNGKFQDIPFLLLQISPAGALSASGTDMGKFMLAHLQDGEYNGERILQADTMRQMHSQSYTFDPALTGIAHGFAEWRINGRRLIGHGGSLEGFRTEMRLIPEERVGIYVSYNTIVGEERSALIEAFMDRYYPLSPAAKATATLLPESQASDPARYTGYYASSRWNSINHPEKIWALTDMRLVRSAPGNTALLFGALLQPPSSQAQDRWNEVQPSVFQNTGDGSLLVFKEDEQGRVRYLATENNSYSIYIKQPWHGRQDLYYGILFFSLLTFLLTPIAALVGFFIWLRKRRLSAHMPWQGRLARGVALGLYLAFMAFLVTFVLHPEDPAHPTILILAWLIAALTLGTTFLAGSAWRKSWWNLAGRIHYTVITLAGLAFIETLAYWKVLTLL